MKKNDGKIDLNLSLPIIFSTFAGEIEGNQKSLYSTKYETYITILFAYCGGRGMKK